MGIGRPVGVHHVTDDDECGLLNACGPCLLCDIGNGSAYGLLVRPGRVVDDCGRCLRGG